MTSKQEGDVIEKILESKSWMGNIDLRMVVLLWT